ncbi:MAG: CARDB domain-containing protein [Candidatus Bathyarchaeum tardum]|nr:MAG: CARDB domain-containing protein [Candidatus Bathyarchaeum tardum]
MSPRSTRNKLKIIFVATLVILAVAVPSYVYVDSLIPKPAKFQVTNLDFDYNWVQVGTPVEISVDVANVGDKAGNHTVRLTIGEVVIGTETVSLSASETETIFFLATELEIGNHTVTVNDLTGSIRVTLEKPVRPAELKLSALKVSRPEAAIGETITVSVTAKNVGDLLGDFSVELFVNDVKQETQNIQLDGTETTTVFFDVTRDIEGEHVVKAGDLTTAYRVSAGAQAATQAEFKFTDLTINPTSVLDDESVTVSVTVTNVGESSGSYDVNLTVDGTTIETKTVTLSGAASKVVEFEITETAAGTHTVEIDHLSGIFVVEQSVSASADVFIRSLSVAPYELWDGQTVTVKAKADNFANEQATLQLRVFVGDVVVTTKTFTLDSGATDVPIEVPITVSYSRDDGKPDGYRVQLVNMGNQTNFLSGYYQVVPDGFHTFSVSVNAIGMEFTIDGETYAAPYQRLLPEGTYIVELPDGFEGGGTWWNWTRWNDGPTSLTRTIELNNRVSLTATYLNCKSCPSLYVWNGEEYWYTAEISDGTGYLGIFDYFQEDGSLLFLYSVPWDYTKLNASRMEPRNGFYDMTLIQKWDEISYIDSATLVYVDHPVEFDVFSTKATYLYDLDEQGTIYTVSNNPSSPVSCVNSTGHNVLHLVSERDGITTKGNEFTWDTLELNLGDLSEAEQIKLLVAGTIIYSTGEEQGEWAGQFFNQPGERPFPPPYMEVRDAKGNWVPVPDNRQFPLLDVTPDCFAINLTGLFQPGDYALRIHTFFNTEFDYIAVDTTAQQEIIVGELPVYFANLTQAFATNSNSTGNFTRYGEVTELLHNPDNQFVIMRQGDQIVLHYSVDDLPEVPEGMERDYFLFASVWFKVDGLFYVDFTVDPLPFHEMSCFPYDMELESYPYTIENQNYIDEYNTRTIENP